MSFQENTRSGATGPKRTDLWARLITIACYLYYHHDISIMSDGDFDKMCVEVADKWEELSPIRQWQLGSPEELKATGYHVKITLAGIEAAADLVWSTQKQKIPRVYLEELKYSEEHGVHYL